MRHTFFIFFLLALLFSGCTLTELPKELDPEATPDPAQEISLGTTPKIDDVMKGVLDQQTITPKKAVEKKPIVTATPEKISERKEGSPRQITFAGEEHAQTQVAGGPTIYFFKANWCPTCQEAQKDLDANISSLPRGTTIIIVDYDKETALKQKYAVTYQHTWVQIDKDGKELVKWNGGGVEEIKKNIK